MKQALRSALITGASSGIGRALALELAGRGTRVWLAARREAELETVCGEIRARGGVAQALLLDVRDPAAVARAVALAEQESGGLDLVVANAGIALHGPGNLAFSAVDELLAVNVRGAFATLCAALPAMRARGAGTLCGISSLAGLRGMPSSGAYSASKAALSTFLESLRADLASSGVRVCDVRPGYVATAMTAQNPYSMPFTWDSARAARRIADALERGQRRCVFPWPSAWALRLLRAGPDWLWDRIAARVARSRQAALAKSSRQGRVSVTHLLGVLLLLLAFTVVGVSVGFWESEQPVGQRSQFELPSPLAEQARAPQPAAFEVPGLAPAQGRDLPPQATEPAAPDTALALVVRVVDARGGPYLAPWRLEARHEVVPAQRAEPLSLACTQPFAQISALQPGAWRVWAVGALGLSTESVVQIRTGAAAQELQLMLLPASRLEGLVLDELGQGLEGLDVFALAAGYREAFRARCDAQGRYRFELLPALEVRLLFGSLRNSLCTPLLFELLPGPQLAPEQTLRGLCSLRLRIEDQLGRPVEGAQISAPNSLGGEVELYSDHNGEGVARYLRPGKWRVLAVHPDLGRATGFRELPSDELLLLTLER